MTWQFFQGGIFFTDWKLGKKISLLQLALFEYYKCIKDPLEVKISPSNFWIVEICKKILPLRNPAIW